MKKDTFVFVAVVLATALTGTCSAELMLTPWGEKVTSENCWRSYPRPQMAREGWTCLNGDWDYQITSITNTMARPEKWAGKIRVPFALEAPLSGCGGRLLEPHEYLWYTRKIDLNPKKGEKTLLHFGAVDFRAVVYLGHDEVGLHEGGQLPFTVDLTPYAKKGENTLTVLVWDPTEDFINTRGKQAFKTHGCFYTRSSGIIQTVWLETVPEKYIADYNVTTDIDKGSVSFSFDVNGLEYGDAELGMVEISASSTSVKAQFKPGESVTLKMPDDFKLWSPEEPNLYYFSARFGKDEIKGYFAMRKFEKRKDGNGVLRFYLNNKPYFVLGTLDQGWWPDGLLTPPSEEAMAFDIQALKDCGYNTMRKHIKVEPLRYYALCDKMGLLVLQDMPCAGRGAKGPFVWQTVKSYALFRDELKGMMDLLKKVPSIVMWVPYNEGWAQHDANLTHTTLDFVKRYDPTRLVDGPSGWQDFEGGQTIRKGRKVTAHKPHGECEAGDVVDYHYYRGPAMPPVNDRRVSFLGEFGGLGHPVKGHIWREFDQGATLGKATGDWGYGGIEDTKTPKGLEKTYLDLMDKLGDLAISGLAGAIYTQTTDVEIEINGILTYDRKVLKFNPQVLKAAHEGVIRKANLGAKPRETVSVVPIIDVGLSIDVDSTGRTQRKAVSKNPIFDGWYADPQIRRYGDTYWVFPTVSDRFEKQTSFDAFSSRDMKTWKKHPRILTTNEVAWAKGAMWAPDAHEIGGKYYLFFSANDAYPVGGKRTDGEPQVQAKLHGCGGIGVAVAERPEGPYRDLIGKPLIDRFWNRAQPIDQYVFEYKGDWYMIYGGWRRCNLVKLAKDMKSIVPFKDGAMWRDMTPKGYVEGSVMFERRGKWYFMYSGGSWTLDNYCVNYSVGDSPFGPFVFKGKVLGVQRPLATGAGHHSVVCKPGTDEWYICYHRRPIPSKGRDHRVVCIDRMEFDENGDIKPIVMTK